MREQKSDQTNDLRREKREQSIIGDVKLKGDEEKRKRRLAEFIVVQIELTQLRKKRF